MCELLGMNANVPTDIRFSFAALAKRGGETGPHKDGWGISFYENKGCRSFHDPNPSAQSELAALVKNYPIKSRMVIAHVRKANRGRVALENTHPFTRELWGRAWTFAHNGQLKGVKELPLSFFRPIGTTDSEYAFCFVMDYLVKTFPDCPPPKVLDREISDLFAQLRGLGVFNALLTDGRSMYASCSKKLCYIKREAPFGRATLIDEDVQVDFAAETTPDDKVIVIATQPLTQDEAWTLVVPDSMLILRGGEVI
ncbi:class II glutamine amidotransferase [Asticcacaulis sp. SL142]|uniref:class II glutamine amidotransferase n=1 Tax=Asticcacaulis sp. SL142 TaxID=2995155 RepID=UPI00226D2E05|nr:class II glutamine amidotransferase [Asticcacaulis sp. SL142]WAC47715.1 class II glutamine amidotransferase [Asticcacaulis sp. SL142]